MTAAQAPVLDPREAEALLRDLLVRASGYVPGWLPAEGSPGQALLRIYARYLQALGERLNRAPAKNRLAFFDLLGVNLLPAQAAVAPVVFKPIAQLGDSRVPARSQVAATVAGRDEPLVFETRRTIALAAAQLVEVVSVWPGKDAYADHTAEALGGQPFVLFDKLRPASHELYLAHDTLLALAGKAAVEVQFELARPASQPLALEWQYWDGELWRSFKAFFAPADASTDDSLDGTAGLTRSGIVRLAADCAETARTRVDGVESYWIRARTTQPLPPSPGLSLPLVDRISISTRVANSPVLPDNAYVDGLKLDLTKTFYPFGQQPGPGTTFYFASEEAFAKPGAQVSLQLEQAKTPLDEDGGVESPEMATEYWNGFAWQPLDFAADERTFEVPPDFEPTKVNGEEAYWLRIRVVEGGFFRERTIRWTDPAKPESEQNVVRIVETVPPALKSLTLAYDYRSPPEGPRSCFTFNDFQWSDYSEEARWRGGSFEPFSLTADRVPAVYFGFDRPLPADALGFYFDIDEVPGVSGPLLRWEAFDGREWLAASVTDETANLTRPGTVALAYPGARPRASAEAVLAEGDVIQLANAQQAAAFQAGNLLYLGETDKGELTTVQRVDNDRLVLRAPVSKTYQRAPLQVAQLPRFGRPRTWLRARLQTDGEPLTSRINGLFFNAVWAEQVRTFEQEVLGSSNGEANQSLFFRQTPVLAGEALEVRELSGPRASVELPILRQELAAKGIGEDALHTATDPRSGAVSEVWVRWQQRPNLFFSGPDDRHYTMERSRGRVVFGDNRNGLIPPVGADNIRALHYSSGGGAIGNVAAGAINQLLSGVPAQGASNPRAAEGGADGEEIGAAEARAPLVMRHRSQAITLADYEALAREASPAVAVARALPNTHPSGRPAIGWVRLIIQPNSQEPRPQPSFGLRRQVEQYLLARIPASMGGRLSVTGPDYLAIGVQARVAPLEQSSAGAVRDGVVKALMAFLHPVSGGPEGTGWPFGRDVYISDVAAVLEAVAGVDYIETLNLLLDGSPRGDVVPVPPDRIVVAGDVRVAIAGSEV